MEDNLNLELDKINHFEEKTDPNKSRTRGAM